MDPDIIKFHGDEKPVWDNFASGYQVSDLFPKDYSFDFDFPERQEINRIIEIIKEHDGIDGFFGFSQGAILTEIMVYYLESGKLDSKLEKRQKPYFVILACPHPGISNMIQFRIPVFMMFGSVDNITKTCFMQLMRFRDATSTYFEGGHKVPVLTSRIARLVTEFVQKAEKNRDKYRNHQWTEMTMQRAIMEKL